MPGNSRYTIALHILAWMALAASKGRHLVTSEQIAVSVNTNAVFLRRVLGLLRDGGVVESQRGSGAGWRLAREPDRITLSSVYDAVVEEPLFAMHHTTPNQRCPIGHGIRPALDAVYRDAEDAVRQQLARTTVADLLTRTLSQSTQG